MVLVALTLVVQCPLPSQLSTEGWTTSSTVLTQQLLWLPRKHPAWLHMKSTDYGLCSPSPLVQQPPSHCWHTTSPAALSRSLCSRRRFQSPCHCSFSPPLPPGGSVTQQLEVNNPSNAALKMRLKISFIAEGIPIADQVDQLSNFPVMAS